MKAFIITGGESTGTRMLVRALNLVGIIELAFPRGFDWSYGNMAFPPSSIVVHCGIPLGGRWLDLWEVAKRIRNEGYEVVTLAMTREWIAVAKSQVNRKYVNNEAEAYENLRSAYRRITQQAVGYTFVSYEQFCLEPQYRKRLFEQFGLPESPIDIHYGNPQHYE